jgi:hypothetical protein
MSEISEVRKESSSSTVSDVEIINDIDESDKSVTGDSNTSRNHSRSSSVSSVNRFNPKQEENEPFVDPLFAESVPPADPLALPPMTDEEYDAIYTEETRAKAIVLLIYFSILMVALPFASMYYCYHYVFNEYDASTDMLYSGLVAIAEVYILVAIFIFIAYKDEQTIEKRIKTKND